MDNEILNFHIPRWNELPNIDLYLDQVVTYLEDLLKKFVPLKDKNEDKVITKTIATDINIPFLPIILSVKLFFLINLGSSIL